MQGNVKNSMSYLTPCPAIAMKDAWRAMSDEMGIERRKYANAVNFVETRVGCRDKPWYERKPVSDQLRVLLKSSFDSWSAMDNST
jgi:hypothetical protein